MSPQKGDIFVYPLCQSEPVEDGMKGCEFLNMSTSTSSV